MDRKSGFRSVRSFAIVIGRAYFEAKKRRKYTKKRSSKQIWEHYCLYSEAGKYSGWQ